MTTPAPAPAPAPVKKPLVSKSFLKDALERTVWTALQALTAAGIVHALGLPQSDIVVLTPVLAAVKAAVARVLPGNPDSAAIGNKGA